MVLWLCRAHIVNSKYTMEIIYVLLPLSLLLALAGVGLYLWSVRNGQLDDLDTPAVRMLFDDEKNNER